MENSLQNETKTIFTLHRKLQPYIPAFLRQRFMSATGLQQLVSGLYTSTLFLTKGPSCPPTAYRSPSRTPTPGDYQGDMKLVLSVLIQGQSAPHNNIKVRCQMPSLHQSYIPAPLLRADISATEVQTSDSGQ